MRGIVAVFVGCAVILAFGEAKVEAQRPSGEPEVTLLDELDEVRVREEVLKLRRDAD